MLLILIGDVLWALTTGYLLLVSLHLGHFPLLMCCSPLPHSRIFPLSLVYAYCQLRGRCSDGLPEYNHFTLASRRLFDLYTVLSLPVILVWRVKIPLRKKFVLMTVFSLTIVIITVSIIRVAVTSHPSKNPSVAWLYLWSSIEMTTCIFYIPLCFYVGR